MAALDARLQRLSTHPEEASEQNLGLLERSGIVKDGTKYFP